MRGPTPQLSWSSVSLRERSTLPLPGRMLAEPVSCPEVNSLQAALRHWARETPDALAVVFLSAEDQVCSLTFAEALALSEHFAGALRERGARRASRVLICLDTGPEQLAAFLACGLLGAVPVLVEPPVALARLQRFQERIKQMVELAGIHHAVVPTELACSLRQSGVQTEMLDPCDVREANCSLEELELSREELCFIQFTSGSTALPKGVMISHEALLANARAIAAGSGWTRSDVMLSWLPLYHDMGLVGATLSPLLHGMPAVLMTPLSFLFTPERWLRAMSHFGASLSVAPNFAYRLCQRKVDHSQLADVDLSRWRLAYNGAEPVLHETITGFVNHFRPFGLRQEIMFPVYGMAEVALAATFPVPGALPRVDLIDRDSLACRGTARPVLSSDRTTGAALPLVSVGRALAGYEIKVVDESGAQVPERTRGEILVRGPSLATGYVGDAEATQQAFRDGWLWTGDLGYVAEGDLFVCGRRKDVIIRGGAKYHAEHLEAVVGRVQGVRAGSVAALGVFNRQSGTEDLVIALETHLPAGSVIRKLEADVARAVHAECGVRPDRIVSVAPRTLPKTSSGKIARSACRRMLIEQMYGVPGGPDADDEMMNVKSSENAVRRTLKGFS
jgi:fatty-acyl-CoA synthase